MEIRKLQRTGGSSFTLTLPKDWIEARGLKEQSEVAISSHPEGFLVVRSTSALSGLARDYTIDGLTLEEVKREIISLYILGYESITVQSGSISKEVRLKVRQTLQVLLGMEIIEESSKHILIKNILNLDKISFQQSTDNMFRMANAMFADAMTALSTRSLALAQDVIERDVEVDKLYFLAVRQHHALLQDISLEEKVGQTLTQAHYYESLSVQLERIADHTVKIARAVVSLGESAPALPEALANTASSLLSHLARLADQVVSLERKKIHTILDGLGKMIPTIEKLNDLIVRSDLVKAVSVGESLSRIHGYLTNLAEIMIDQSFVDDKISP